MISRIHKRFTEQILLKCGLPESYAQWASAPDEDFYRWHRYKYHKLSSFNHLYYYCIEKYDMRHCLNTKIVSFVFLGHLYIDMLNGMVKVHDGLNITMHHSIYDMFQQNGYLPTIINIYKTITDPSEEYINAVCDEFKTMPPTDFNTLSVAFYDRLKEETIGLIDDNHIKRPHIPSEAYQPVYDYLVEMENKVINYMVVHNQY